MTIMGATAPAGKTASPVDEAWGLMWRLFHRYGKGRRWQARYLDPEGRERTQMFDRKQDAERFLSTITAAVLRGAYVDPDAGRVTFVRERTGQRVFDLNTDGVAHYGLFADVVGDMLTRQASRNALPPLFHSAEAYLRMWERAVHRR